MFYVRKREEPKKPSLCPRGMGDRPALFPHTSPHLEEVSSPGQSTRQNAGWGMAGCSCPEPPPCQRLSPGVQHLSWSALSSSVSWAPHFPHPSTFPQRPQVGSTCCPTSQMSKRRPRGLRNMARPPGLGLACSDLQGKEPGPGCDREARASTPQNTLLRKETPGIGTVEQGVGSQALTRISRGRVM